jgi:hypothetical protein
VEYSGWRSRLWQVGVEIGGDAECLAGHGWEEEVGQGEHAPLVGGPWSLELGLPWRVVAERV